MRALRRLTLLLPLMALASGCQDPEWANRTALQVGAPRVDAAEIRERQTALFPAASEERLLVEATQVLQDLGFTIEESAARFGVLAGSKDRDATEAPQVIGQVALMVAFAVLGAQYNPTWDSDQVIRATLSTRQISTQEASLRVSFERIVTDNRGMSRVEELTAPEFSSGFFEKVRAGLAQRT